MLAYLQKLGKSLMLPIAVLPVAGLFLRLGQPDVLDIPVISSAGGAIFDNLALLFALGIAVGMSKDQHGASAISGAVAYLTLLATATFINEKINMGVFSGIISGIIAGELYNHFKDVRLPDFLSFFSGRRLVPILSGFLGLISGYILGYIWPFIESGLENFASFLAGAGA